MIKLYIRKEGSEWVVHAESGKVLGRHKTKQDAEKQLQAVEINKHKHKYKTVLHTFDPFSHPMHPDTKD